MIMKRIVVRRWNTVFPELCEANPGYSVTLLPPCVFIGRADALILEKPSIGEIISESTAAAERDAETDVIVFAEPYRKAMLEALFPSVTVADAADMNDAGKLLPYFIQGGKRCDEIVFSEREERFLRELPYGLSNGELSLRLGMSERSVRRMKEKLLARTGLLSSGQLMLYAALRGIRTRSS